MNYETLRRLQELELKVKALEQDNLSLRARVADLEQKQERRTLTLPKKNG